MSRISVVILSYNYAAFIREAIESALNQSFKDIEVVIADDGSTDDSVAIAREYGDPRCIVLTGENVGLELNLARALQATSCELIAITSADDRWLSNHLDVGVRALDANPQACLSYSLMRSIDEAGGILHRSRSARQPHFPSGKIDPWALLPGQFIPTQTTLFRRAAVDAVGGFDTSLHLLELDLIVRLVERYAVVFTGHTTGEYRVKATSLSGDPERMLAARLALYSKHLVGSDARIVRQFEGSAMMKTAYREMVSSPTSMSVRLARRNIIGAARRDLALMKSPLHVLMMGASVLGPLYPRVYRATHRLASRRSVKTTIQRLFALHAPARNFGAPTKSVDESPRTESSVGE